MLLVAGQSVALDHLHRWLRVGRAQPFKSPTNIQQVFPVLFPVCTGLGVCHVIPSFYIFVQ
jgi:hypothetical protein